MSMNDHFADVRAWIYKQHPQYEGWRIRSFAWDYDLANLPSEIFHSLYDKFEDVGEIELADVKAHIERVQPPEGYAYITLQKDDVRVGFNVPKEVFQTKE